MKYIGAHLSISDGIDYVPTLANLGGFTGFGLFVKNPRTYKSSPLPTKVIDRFKADCINFRYNPDSILPHSSYLVNLANPDPSKHVLSISLLQDEIERCSLLGLTMINLHPGSSLGIISDSEACQRVSESINYILDRTSGVSIIIECTAGKKNVLGGKFEDIAKIISGVEDKGRIGVCIDTCHAYDSGYDLLAYDKFWEEYDKVIGKEYLKGMHLNDSLYGLGSKKDRHESLGEGKLGWGYFKTLINDPRTSGIPLILETPNSDLWGEEVSLLKSFSLLVNDKNK